MKVHVLDEDGRLTGPVTVSKVVKPDAHWKAVLTQEQYDIARGKGTEPALCGVIADHKKSGIYSCICCGLPLFNGGDKVDSGSGWPSFFQPIAAENVVSKPDRSHGMDRTEILCARCDAHLGHVFEDGPKPTGLRYCLNGAAMLFRPHDEDGGSMQKATFAAGCFWGVEDMFRKISGVRSVMSGYTGGTVEYPTYEEVYSYETGHAEAVLVVYDPAVVSYDDLLDAFWRCHDPTQSNRQGPDVGSQYRSMIFFFTNEQRDAAMASKQKLDAGMTFTRPIVTKILPAAPFYPAEEYHQRYVEKHGAPTCHIR